MEFAREPRVREARARGHAMTRAAAQAWRSPDVGVCLRVLRVRLARDDADERARVGRERRVQGRREARTLLVALLNVRQLLRERLRTRPSPMAALHRG
eukprot:1630073-Pleurochrysis_carterae.AAC.1